EHNGKIGELESAAESSAQANAAASAEHAASRQLLDTKHSAFSSAQHEVSSLLDERNTLTRGAAQSRARMEELALRRVQIEGEEQRLLSAQQELKSKEHSASVEHEKTLRSLADAEQSRREAHDQREELKSKIDDLQSRSFAYQKEIGQYLS